MAPDEDIGCVWESTSLVFVISSGSGNHLDNSNLTLNNANKTICSSESLSEFIGKSILEFDPQMACGVNVLTYICSSLLILSFIVGITLAYRYRWWR